MNQSFVRALDHITLLASQGQDATFKMGSRYPILNSSYSSVYSSSVLQVLGVSSSSSTIPFVSYEDIGLVVKSKTLVHGNSDVSLDLEIQFRTLGITLDARLSKINPKTA